MSGKIIIFRGAQNTFAHCVECGGQHKREILKEELWCLNCWNAMYRQFDREILLERRLREYEDRR